MIDRLLVNGVVYTQDRVRPRASCIAIWRDRIVAVGGEEVRGLAGASTVVEDLGGRAVFPTFTDSHIHWSWTAINLREVNLMDVPSKEEAARRVGEYVRGLEPGKWVRGFGWAQGMWPGMAFPTAADLDAVAAENPVWLSARSGHAGWANSMALKLAGITDSTPDPEGGQIQRDARGRATGILFEEAMAIVSRCIPDPTPHEIADAAEIAQPLAWKCGLGALHDYDRWNAFSGYQIMRERGTLGLRIVKQINDPWIHHAHALGLRTGLGDAWLRIGALKIFADGALGSVTAQMLEPYDGQPDNKGIVVTTKERMDELVIESTKLGIPATIHAIGDEAVRHVLDVYEHARAVEAELGIPRSARRHRIEHFQFAHPSDIPRAKELDVIVSIQPIHGTNDYPMVDKYLGARGQFGYNARRQIDNGAVVVFGSDSPVEDFNPLIGIHAAVTRRRLDGMPGPDGWWPSERITVEEAVRCYTVGPAWAAGLENEAGILAPGYLADLTVLDRDIHRIDPHEIKDVMAVATMIGGEWRWRA